MFTSGIDLVDLSELASVVYSGIVVFIIYYYLDVALGFYVL